MIRRSLRIGIRLGLLTGVIIALFKLVQSRRVRPDIPEADGWPPPADSPLRSAQPGLVQPTMPDHPIGQRDRPPASAAPGPGEPFAEPGVGAAVDDAPLDAVAEPVVEVDDPLARAPQAEAAPPPATEAPTPKRAPARKAAKAGKATRAGKAAKKAKKAARAAKKAKKATRAAKKAGAPKATAAKAPAAKKRASKATAAKAPAAKKRASKATAAKAPAAKKRASKATAAKAPAAKKRASKATATGAETATKAVRAQTGVRWVQPVAGSCPASHPVKAKMSSGIFHLPGMAAYNRLAADRCYPDGEAAESDGLRPAKR